ncbi:MAG: flagellar biosynthetic protein FliR [bacterium]
MEPFLQITSGAAGPLLSTVEERFITFLLVFVRCIALISSAPVFNSRSVPGMVKAIIAVGMAVVLEAALPAQEYKFVGVLRLVLLGIGEALIGLMLGFAAHILFQSLTLAGEVIGQQAGFAIVTALDPTTDQDAALVGQILMMLGTLILLAVNGHLLLLRIVADTFWAVPPGSIAGIAALRDASQAATGPMSGTDKIPGFYDFGVRIAAPIVVALIAMTLANGIMAKTAPQVNIMVIGFALRILIGLFVLIFSLPMICILIKEYMMEGYPNWAYTIISWLRTGPTG